MGRPPADTPVDELSRYGGLQLARVLRWVVRALGKGAPGDGAPTHVMDIRSRLAIVLVVALVLPGFLAAQDTADFAFGNTTYTLTVAPEVTDGRYHTHDYPEAWVRIKARWDLGVDPVEVGAVRGAISGNGNPAECR